MPGDDLRYIISSSLVPGRLGWVYWRDAGWVNHADEAQRFLTGSRAFEQAVEWDLKDFCIDTIRVDYSGRE